MSTKSPKLLKHTRQVCVCVCVCLWWVHYKDLPSPIRDKNRRMEPKVNKSKMKEGGCGLHLVHLIVLQVLD